MGYGMVVREPWWTPDKRQEQIESLSDGSDCGGWGWDGPCGGCERCLLMQEAYYFCRGYAEPAVVSRRYGLNWWPIIFNGWVNGKLESFPESHERSHWWTGGECANRKKEMTQ